MKKTTTFIFVVLALIVSTTGYAQQPAIGTWGIGDIPQHKAAAFAEEMLQKTPYVFDGIVVKQHIFKHTDGHIYTSRLVAVQMVRRGKVRGDTVEVITRYGCIRKEKPTGTSGGYVEFRDYDCEGWADDMGNYVGTGAPIGAYVVIFGQPNTLPRYYKNTKHCYQLYHDLWGQLSHFQNNAYGGIFVFNTLKDLNMYFDKYGLYPKEGQSGKPNGNGDASERTQVITNPNIQFDKKVVTAEIK